jgi:flagellar biosynthesis/type III secretory pathway M-ring protein FliF/YscJ
MDAYIKAMCTTFRTVVKNACDNPPDDHVLVDAYPDFINPLGDAPTQAVSGVSLLLTNHGKEIALGALAVISLFMVSMMVRKSGPALAAAGGAAGEGGVVMVDGQPVPAGVGSTVDAIIGKTGGNRGLVATVTDEVAEGDPMLDGVEVDDEALRSRQVAEQVVNLVKDNPDAAANLIKRWMNRT